MTTETITHLMKMSPHHAVQVRKNKGKTSLYLTWDGKSRVRIRNSNAKLKQMFTAPTEELMIEKLQQAGYEYFRM